MSKIYKLTVFDSKGEKLLDESVQAENDDQAKEKGEAILKDKSFTEYTYRCTSPGGKLVLFHR